MPPIGFVVHHFVAGPHVCGRLSLGPDLRLLMTFPVPNLIVAVLGGLVVGRRHAGDCSRTLSAERDARIAAAASSGVLFILCCDFCAAVRRNCITSAVCRRKMRKCTEVRHRSSCAGLCSRSRSATQPAICTGIQFGLICIFIAYCCSLVKRPLAGATVIYLRRIAELIERAFCAWTRCSCPYGCSIDRGIPRLK